MQMNVLAFGISCLLSYQKGFFGMKMPTRITKLSLGIELPTGNYVFGLKIILCNKANWKSLIFY